MIKKLACSNLNVDISRPTDILVICGYFCFLFRLLGNKRIVNQSPHCFLHLFSFHLCHVLVHFKETEDMYNLNIITLRENCISGLINLNNSCYKNYTFPVWGLTNSFLFYGDAFININSGKSAKNSCITNVKFWQHCHQTEAVLLVFPFPILYVKHI